jgi:hypothetical protein
VHIKKHFVHALFGMALLLCAPRMRGQSFYQQLRSHNASMTDLQPTWMGPLIQSDARLSQSVRFSVSELRTPGKQSIRYGNNHGMSLIAAHRFQFEFDPPSFFRNHSSASPDSFGNAGMQVKYRIASGNAQHGNFAISAADFHGFAPGAVQNGMLTAFDCPKIAAGIARGRFDVQTTLGGVLPAGRVATQGRALEWNVTGQVHPTSQTWLDLEDNASFFAGGPSDGKVQNFLTPAVFYAVRRKSWETSHPVFVFAAGIQIATSHFHRDDHNWIAELRVLF